MTPPNKSRSPNAFVPRDASSSAPHLPDAAPPGLLPFSDVQLRVRLSRTSIYALIGSGSFPKPVKIGRASRWLSTEIDALIESLAARRGPPATNAGR